MTRTITKKALTLAAAACLLGGYAVETRLARAEDPMMKGDGMMMQHADMMKKMVTDPAMMPSAEDLAKAQAMQETVMMMAKDPEFQKMHMATMKDGKMMSPSADAVKMAKESMMKDPAMMKMAMAHAMAMSMSMDHDMGKMAGDKMNGGKMDAPKMDDKMGK